MLAEFADFAQGGFVGDLNLAAVDHNHFFVDKCGQRADGVGGGHVGEVGQIFTRHVDAQCHSIGLKSIVVDHHHQRLGKSTADVLLSEVDRSGVGAAEIARKLMDEEPSYIAVAVD